MYIGRLQVGKYTLPLVALGISRNLVNELLYIGALADPDLTHDH